jgi:hypothetical protein
MISPDPPSKLPPDPPSESPSEEAPAASPEAATITPRYAWGIAKLVVRNDPDAPRFAGQPRTDELARELLASLLWQTRCPSRQEMGPIVDILDDTDRLRATLAATVAAPSDAAPLDGFALRALSLLDHPAGRAARKLTREAVLGGQRRA